MPILGPLSMHGRNWTQLGVYWLGELLMKLMYIGKRVTLTSGNAYIEEGPVRVINQHKVFNSSLTRN